MTNTHEEFLKSLEENNTAYSKGDFKVIGKFKGVKFKIILKDQYGYCSVLPDNLTRGLTTKMTIRSAIFKTEYLKEYLRQNIKEFRINKFRVVSNYTTGKNKILILDSSGNFHKITPDALFSGRLPSIKSAINKDEYLFKKLCNKNIYFKNGYLKYLGFFYENQKMRIKVSDKYGEYTMGLSSAYSNSKPDIKIAIDKDLNLRNRLSENGGEYDYSNAIYSKMNDKVIICCDKHNFCFDQSASNHISGKGCRKCASESISKSISDNPIGWTYTNWIKAANKSKNFDSFKVYIVKMKSNTTEEEFYKIGRTFLTLTERFKSIKHYKIIEVIAIIENECGRLITEKESELLSNNKAFKYKPENKFGGESECFKKVIYD